MACFSLIMEHQFCLRHFFLKLFIKALLSRLLDTSAIEIHYYYYYYNFRHTKTLTKHMERTFILSLGSQAQHTHSLEDHTWSI